MGEEEFGLIFVLHRRGAPDHNRPLDDMGDYLRDALEREERLRRRQEDWLASRAKQE